MDNGLPLGAPVLSWNADDPNPTIRIQVIGGSTGSSFCGMEGNNVITLAVCDTNVINGGYGSLDQVVAHELSSMLGWNDANVERLLDPGKDFHTPEAIGVSDRCISILPAVGQAVRITGGVCLHDVDGLIRLYAAGGTDVNLGSLATYWGTNILNQSDVAISGTTLAVGDSIAITATRLFSTSEDAGYSFSTPTTPSNFQYLPISTNHFLRRGNYLIAQSATSQARFRLRPVGAPTSFTLYSPFASQGRLFTVATAPPPPPPPPPGTLVISSLQVPDTTLHVGSTVLFSATVGGVQAGEQVTLHWTFDESDTPGLDGSYQTTTYSISRWVREGSYTLRVTVIPWSNLRGVGSGQIRDVVVCPDPGGGGGGGPVFVLAPETTGAPLPPPDTDAKAGCA